MRPEFEKLRTAGSFRARMEDCSTSRYKRVAPPSDITSAMTAATAIVAWAPTGGPKIRAVLKQPQHEHLVDEMLITYLKLTGCPAGLLINFNSTTVRAGLRRVDHPDRYVKKRSA